GLIGLVIVVCFAVAAATGSLGVDRKHRNSYLGASLGIGLGAGLALLTYWTIYAKNPTWGSDPGTELSALAIASFTAATSGLLTPRRLIPTKPDSDEGKGAGQRKDTGASQTPAAAPPKGA